MIVEKVIGVGNTAEAYLLEDDTDLEKLLSIKRELARLYLESMKVTRDMIRDYLFIISVARVGECPDE